MILTPQPSHFFIFIALTVGLLTTATDIWQRKIYNLHLLIGAGLGFVVACYAFLIDFQLTISHLTNGGLAFLIGWLLYHVNIWRGGDAKLFALYAFLMPPIEEGTTLFSGAIRLFACSFVFAMIIIMPIFIKDIILNYGGIADDILARRNSILKGIVTSIFFSWVMFPVYYLAKTTSPIFVLTISYLLYIWGYDDDEAEATKHSIFDFLKKKYIELCIGIPLGFLMRLWIAPDSLSWPLVVRSILMIGASVTISACIHTALNHLKEYRDRVPFAPLLFMGCVLSYTLFLTWIIHLIPR